MIRLKGFLIFFEMEECYYTCILEILRSFFILQSLTTSKMRKFQTLKLSQFHKEKTCWTENWWSSGIMSNFLGEFFCVLGFKIFFGLFIDVHVSLIVLNVQNAFLVCKIINVSILSHKTLLIESPKSIFHMGFGPYT